MDSIVVFITTYNRSEELKSTLESLFSDRGFLQKNNVQFEVYDDKSDKEHAIKNLENCRKHNVKYYTSSKNRGKENFWMVHKKIISSLNSKQFDYVFSLQDDYVYEDNFFSKAANIFKTILQQDSKMTCLNLQPNRIGQKYWNTLKNASGKLLDINGIQAYKVSWVDCVYMANRKFFDMFHFRIKPIHKDRWKRNKNKSSGVGQSMSEKITSSCSVYQLKNPLVTHTGVPTQMGRKI